MIKLWNAKSAMTLAVMAILTGCTLSPEPITQCDRAERIAQDKEDMFSCQEPVRNVVSLSEAMARALKYNLDLRLKTADSILARSDYSITKYEMLPDLVGSAGYISRSTSYAVRTSPESNIVSFSQDRHRRVADLQLTWNILDFGVSYIQAKQKGDQFLIAIERRRKMEQNIMRDVRYAYFRTVSAQRIMGEIDPLMAQVKKALRSSRKLESEQTQSPLEALRYQKSLLATLRQLTTLRKELANAKRELAALMNVPPGRKFRVSESINGLEVLPRGFSLKMSRLEYLALQHRPEIREEDYRTRISANEITKAKLRMFPGLEATAGLNNDSNSFLVSNNWANYGAQLTWNLMRIFSGPANIERAKRELLVSNVRRMALSMAILTQVDVAYLRYRETRKELQVAQSERDVAKRIHRKVLEGFSAKKQTEMALIQARTDMVLSKLRYDLVYAEWQNSAGQLLNSVGYDLLPVVDTCLPVSQLKQQLHVALNTEPSWLMRSSMPRVYSKNSGARTSLRALAPSQKTPVATAQTSRKNTAQPMQTTVATAMIKKTDAAEPQKILVAQASSAKKPFAPKAAPRAASKSSERAVPVQSMNQAIAHAVQKPQPAITAVPPKVLAHGRIRHSSVNVRTNIALPLPHPMTTMASSKNKAKSVPRGHIVRERTHQQRHRAMVKHGLSKPLPMPTVSRRRPSFKANKPFILPHPKMQSTRVIPKRSLKSVEPKRISHKSIAPKPNRPQFHAKKPSARKPAMAALPHPILAKPHHPIQHRVVPRPKLAKSIADHIKGQQRVAHKRVKPPHQHVANHQQIHPKFTAKKTSSIPEHHAPQMDFKLIHPKIDPEEETI